LTGWSLIGGDSPTPWAPIQVHYVKTVICLVPLFACFRTGAETIVPTAVVLLALLLSACSKPVPTEEPVRAVKVITVGMQELQTGIEYSGEIRARVESRLAFRVSGKLVKRSVEAGQRVKAGQLLAQLDPQDFLLAADAAKAQVAAAATNRNLAESDYKRAHELKEQNFISRAELERRDSTLKASQALLDQAQAQFAVQQNQATYPYLLADASGVITTVDTEVGQVVSAGTTVVRIARDGPRDVVFAVPEDRVQMMKLGSMVGVRSWSRGGTQEGTVREVAAIADPVTRTYLVKVSLDEKDTKNALPLGATVYVTPQVFSLKGVQMIRLPTSALKQDGKTTAVWLLDSASMTLKSQPVEVKRADGNEAIISTGLQPGMQVVSAGVHVLQAGQKVSLYNEKLAPAIKSGAQETAEAATQAVAPKPASSAFK